MPEQTTEARPYTGPGQGSAKTSSGPGPSVITTDRTLKDWLDRCHDQPVAWLCVRLIHCKFYWLSIGGQWERNQRNAAAWREREDAYQAARQANGLLYCYDRA